MIKLGLSVLLQEKTNLIKNRSVGLITNATGVDEGLRDNVSLLAAKSQVNLRALFTPEHGFFRATKDGSPVSFTTDERTNLQMNLMT